MIGFSILPGTGEAEWPAPLALPIRSRILPGVDVTVGVITRDRLWRNARATIGIGRRIHDAEGMADIVAMLSDASDGAMPLIALPLHPGYVAVYGRDGWPSSRLLRTGRGWTMRRFQPHESIEFPDLTTAIDEATRRP